MRHHSISITTFVFRPPRVDRAPAEVIRDIITRVDTIRDTIPVPVYVRVVDSVPVPVFIPVLGDTVRDTVYLLITQKVYRDSLYTAYVSGYRAKQDSIEVYGRTNTITIREQSRRKRWGLGVQAGNRAGPYVGVGVSYNLFGW